jgi:hypothetical protein
MDKRPERMGEEVEAQLCPTESAPKWKGVSISVLAPCGQHDSDTEIGLHSAGRSLQV